jgi:hypothetical protein
VRGEGSGEGQAHVIFMSQTGITDPAREAELDAWYVEHLRIMLTVKGVDSAQRFKTTSPGAPPSLAMYSVASPRVFQDPYYLSVRGMGEWLPLLDRDRYRRNLFDGLDRAPEVGQDERLLVADRERPEPALLDLPWAWLECVGIDRSTPFRGIAVVRREIAEAHPPAHGVALYAPVTAFNRK